MTGTAISDQSRAALRRAGYSEHEIELLERGVSRGDDTARIAIDRVVDAYSTQLRRQTREQERCRANAEQFLARMGVL